MDKTRTWYSWDREWGTAGKKDLLNPKTKKLCYTMLLQEIIFLFLSDT